MPCRRSLIAAGALCSALALAACGSSSSSSSKPLTTSQATAVANAINLTAADVPSSTASPPSPNDKQAAAQLASCAGGVPPSQEIVDIDSPSLSTGSGLTQQQASSNVTVQPSVADVQQNLHALTSAKGHACLNASLNTVLSKTTSPGVTFSSGTITTLPFSSAHTDGGFAARVTVKATAQGLHIPFYLDVIGFAKGPTEVELQTLGISQPYPAAQEARLLALLVSRANAHAPSS